MTVPVNPDGQRPSSTGDGRGLADQSTWRKKLQASRLKFDDPAKQVYLEQLAQHGRKGDAARAAGVSISTVHGHRDNDPEFAEAEAEAFNEYRDKFVAHAASLAYDGIEVRKYNKDGELIEERRDYPIRLIELHLKYLEPGYRERGAGVFLDGMGGEGAVGNVTVNVKPAPSAP